MHNDNKTLGILGGLGPMSSAYFYEMLTEHTAAATDQEHLDIVVSSRATTPDRTDYILDHSAPDPFAVMSEEMKKLEAYGADVIAIPCNTAHFFYDRLVACVRVPVLNMVDSTVAVCAARGVKKLGVMATSGTVKAGIYTDVCRRRGIEPVAPSDAAQDAVTRIIYDQIKSGRPAQMADVEIVAHDLFGRGCDAAVLACTELSVAKKQLSLDGRYIDALEVLALSAIEACGKKSVGFEDLMI